MANTEVTAALAAVTCKQRIVPLIWPIECFHIHDNKNDINSIRNFSVIMPYLCYFVEQPLRDVVLQFASFLKGKDTHHICYSFPYIITINCV